MQFGQDDVTEPTWERLAEPSPKHGSENSSEKHSEREKEIKRRSAPRAAKACDHCVFKKTKVDSGPAPFSNGSVFLREIVTNVMRTMLYANTRATIEATVHIASHLSMRVV